MVGDLKHIYGRRFGGDIEFRKSMYEVLCSKFYQKYIPVSSTVLDVGAGYCEFINNICAAKKYALDLNPDIKKFCNDDVEVLVSKSTNMKSLKKNSVDVVFSSNFFEHISKDDIIKTISEIKRILKSNGRLLILQPNFRYCYKSYWSFFDHMSALDDKSMCEVLETNNFKIVKCMPKFLPYTTKSRLPKSIFLLKLYLKLPFVQKIFGKQFFIYAIKS
jgi:ubiquinone/menaquinone biosynthesis C-methylase UbiE